MTTFLMFLAVYGVGFAAGVYRKQVGEKIVAAWDAFQVWRVNRKKANS